jgi:molybdopterin molybdotransferase
MHYPSQGSGTKGYVHLSQSEPKEAIMETAGTARFPSSLAPFSRQYPGTDKIIHYSQAVKKCLSEVQQPLPSEFVPVIDALGRTLREDIRCPFAIPPFSRSVMDGYAVRWHDLTGASRENPRALEVIGDLPAGKKNGKRISQGQTIRIMTGAPMPEGADAVVMVEDTECVGSRVNVLREVKEGENIAFAGEDVEQGTVILSQGVRIGPAEMGMLAACGRASVSVSQRPKIGILSTGDELAAPGTPCGAAQIYDVNGYTLFGLARQAGAGAEFIGIAGDRYEELLQILNKSGDFDVLIISGGGSVGDYDIVQDALLQAGMRKVLWNTKINPGKSLFVGRRFRQLIFAMPGNPISSMLNFLFLVRPVLDKMKGQETQGLRTAQAVVLEEMRLRSGQRKFLRARLMQINETIGVKILPWKRSSGVHSMVEADVLVEVPEQIERLRPGDKVKIYYLD